MNADQIPQAVEVATKFLETLFAPDDFVHFRPMETWTEADRKKSEVIWPQVFTERRKELSHSKALSNLVCVSIDRRANLFFGVCPRFGCKGAYELAWQVRCARTLWADLDRTTIAEATERVAAAKLPEPSIVVDSGNGAHLYWLLDTPYVIDDVGDPLPVLKEWPEESSGKRPRKYIEQSGDRLYLDQRPDIARLSAKAIYFQEVLSGVAKSIGGDHTTDLVRLLRLPGSWNRKDQRNGREPIATQLVECDSSKRYAISRFEGFKAESLQTAQARQIAAMPLPTPRKPSPRRLDRLAELIAACVIAPAGQRSEPDFAVCCYAIRNSIPKEDVWQQVGSTGKFAEQGRRYFDLTWESAEFSAREWTFRKVQKQPTGAKVSTQRLGGGDKPQVSDAAIAQDNGHPTIVVNSKETPVAQTLNQITDHLLATGKCFLRSNQLVVVRDEQIDTVLSTPELGGLVNEFVELYFVEDEESGQYKPLPTSYGNTWLNQYAERTRLPEIKLFTRNPVFAADWRLVAPGFDVPSGIFYAGPKIEPLDSTEHLDALLCDFCFKAPGDRTNYLGMLLTALLVPRFIGSKPAALFNGNQPELGKSILAQVIAILRDGQAAETATYNSNDEEFEKRLGAIVRRGCTTIIIDNAKANNRNPRIDSACLERSITDPILSFRLLGQSASIRAENSHIFCITANTPDVSRDLVTRSVVINLHHEGNPERRAFSIADPEGYAQEYRTQLLGELAGMVERWKASQMPMAKVHSRFNKRQWGNIVGGILEACGEPDFLANAEDASLQLDETKRDFAELVALLARNARGSWTASELVAFCKDQDLTFAELGEGSARSQSTRLGTLAGRFIGEQFRVNTDQVAVFHRIEKRNGNEYQVEIL